MDNVTLIPEDASVIEARKHGPCDKEVDNLSSLGGQATVTVVAGSTGVRRVCTGVTFSWVNTAAVAATTVQIAVIDGVSGGTTFLWRAVVVMSSIGANIYSTPTMQRHGSTATALTAEFSAGVAGVTQCVSLAFHDIGGGIS